PRSSGRRCAIGKIARAIKQDFRRPRGAGSRKHAGDRKATSIRDADATPAGSPRGQVGQSAMMRAIGRLADWAIAKSEIAVLGTAAERPPASSRAKCEDRGGGRA